MNEWPQAPSSPLHGCHTSRVGWRRVARNGVLVRQIKISDNMYVLFLCRNYDVHFTAVAETELDGLPSPYYFETEAYMMQVLGTSTSTQLSQKVRWPQKRVARRGLC